MRHALAAAVLTTIALLAVTAQAQDAAPRRAAQTNEAPRAQTAGPGVLALLPANSVTEHELTSDSGTLRYTATAGTLNLYDQNGQRTAAIFYTAYVAKDAPASRPLTFAFNGGPGAASAYLHLGVLGPRILDFEASDYDGAAARLADNPQSWLAFTDLVFIDPVGTGWSRTAKSDDTSFYGVRQDAQAMAKVIALYIARAGRAGQPKYLVGESYGGFRAAKVAAVLQRDQGIALSGIVMLSPLLEGALQFGANRFALGAALQLPSLAAAELERRKAFTPQALAAAERFAMTDYLTTLAGPPPSDEEARRFYARVAELTGLPVNVVTRMRGFVRNAYRKNLRGSDGDIVSHYDVGFAAPDPFPDSESPRGDDPVLDGFTRAYGGAFVGYAREQLGFKTDMTYTLLANDVNSKWNWDGRGGRDQAGVSDDIRQILALTPSLRILVAHGYSDLVTPYGVSRYVIDHLPPLGEGNRMQLRLYRGGHMFYTAREPRLAFTADVRDFYGAPRGP